MYSPLMPVHWSRAGLREMPSHKSGQARHGLSYVGCKKKTIWARHMLSLTHIHPPSIHPYNTRSRAEQAPPAVAAPVSPTERPSTVVTQAPGCASRAFSNFALLCYTTLPRAMCEYTVCIHSTEWRCLLRLYCMCSTRAPLVCRTL